MEKRPVCRDHSEIGTELSQRRNLARLDTRSPRRIKTSFALRFYHEVLHLDHLHYGIWNEESLDFDGLRSAQQRYAERLIALIPSSVEAIIDVGAGIGTMSSMLLERGFEVEGLSPDPYQERLYRQRVGRPFHLCRFQEWQPESPFDLVMMSESAQYVWLESLFPTVKDVAPGGFLLVADYFVLNGNGTRATRSGHSLESFLRVANTEGFELEVQDDVTEEVLPTLTFGKRFYDRHVSPALDLLGEGARIRYPGWSSLISLLVRKQLAKIDEIPAFLDIEAFRRNKTYQFLRFRVPGG